MSLKQMSYLIVLFMLLSSCLAFAQDDTQIHAFVSQGYFKTDKNNFLLSNSKDGSWEFNEAAISVMVSAYDKVRIGLQLYGRDMGDQGNHELGIDWAYGDYRWQDFLGIRVGRFKSPMSMYNDVRDIDMARISLLLPQSNYDDSSRDFALAVNGLNLYGNVPMSSLGDIDYEMFAGNMGINDTRSLLFQNIYYSTGSGVATGMALSPQVISASYDGSSKETATLRDVFGIKAKWNTPMPGLMIGAAMSKLTFEAAFNTHYTMVVPTPVPNVTMAMSREISVDELIDVTVQNVFGEYMWNNLTLAAEMQMQIQDGMVDVGDTPSTVDKTEQKYFGMVSYRLFDWFALGSYYAVNYSDKDDKEGKKQVEQGNPDYFAWQKDIAFSARIDVTSNWLLKIEYHRINGTSQIFPVMNPDGIEKDWTIFAFKSTYNF